MAERYLTIANHLRELRQRLVYCILFFAIAFGVGYFFAEQIYSFLLKPLMETYGNNHNRRIIYTGLTEAFMTYLRLGFISAMFISTPFFITQFYLFVSPGLYKKEKRLALSLIISSPFLFILGALLLYYFVLPFAFEFFISFEVLGSKNSMPIELEARISEYLDLIIKLIFGFGLAFQLPIILIFLVRIGLLSVEGLKSKRKYWVVLIFTVAAILTPPDVVSQILLAIPMLLLYESAIIISAIIIKNKKKQQEENDQKQQ